MQTLSISYSLGYHYIDTVDTGAFYALFFAHQSHNIVIEVLIETTNAVGKSASQHHHCRC